MRILISGVIGGLVFFFWGAVAHLALPIGTMGMQFAAPHEAVLGAMKQDFQGEGVYILPSLPKDKMGDADATKAFAPTETSNPYAFVVYQTQGKDTSQMGDNLVKQWASDTLSALIVSFVLALGAFGFGKRVLVSAALGLFSWLTVSVPWWNWYRFPMDFTIGSLLEQVVGWLIAGIAMAWWLGRKEAK
jgi:hypothetical protein